MTTDRGLWIPLEADGNLAEVLESMILNNKSFNKTVSRSGIQPAKAELCLLSLERDQFTHLAISRAGIKRGFDEREIALSHFVELQNANIETIVSEIPKRLQSNVPAFGSRPERISPATWNAILESILKTNNSLAPKIQALNQSIHEHLNIGNRTGSLISTFERDAVATSLEVFSGRSLRKQVLDSSVRPIDAPSHAPFLTTIPGSVLIREDTQIEHDLFTFPGFLQLRGYMVGIVELSNEAGEKLTLINANRRKLEEALGVDLIYWNHRFNSYVMVQYKRMREKDGGYRPMNDKSHESELERMNSIVEYLESTPKELVGMEDGIVDSYRLSDDPFYFKLCNEKCHSPLDSSMTKGMYFPLGLWDKLLTSERTQGKRGGTPVINWENCPRRFSNSEFTSLLRSGWIGSKPQHSNRIHQLVKHSLEGDKSLIIAISAQRGTGKEYRRDTVGRFTPEDNPLGST